ncbi:MAG TPA: ABC transporter permease [Casimicrobiaceae bacterium]|nr:ABC transporter permease [Casimicrobiaceae bacterium]
MASRVALSSDASQDTQLASERMPEMGEQGLATLQPLSASERQGDAMDVAEGQGAIRRVLDSRVFLALCAFASFITVWYLIASWIDNRILIPSPSAVASALDRLASSGELFHHAAVSTTRLAIALVVSILIAVPLGFAMGMNRTFDAYIDPVVEMVRPVSGIAWIPIGLSIFGVGDVLPVFIMVYVAFFPLLLNTAAGVRNVDRRLLNAANTMGIKRLALLRYVIVPAALPTIMVGLRLAFAGAWAAIIAAELIGSPSGLGFSIEWYRELLMSPKMFAFIVVIGIVGYVCDLALRGMQRLATPWAEGLGLG